MTFFVAFLVEIAITLSVPTVIVLDPAALTFPVAVIVTLAIVPRRHPAGPTIGRTSPISLMPPVVAFDRVPIAVHPSIIGTRGYWSNRNYARRRWWADPDSKIYFSRKCQSDGQQRQGKHFLYHV